MDRNPWNSVPWQIKATVGISSASNVAKWATLQKTVGQKTGTRARKGSE